MQEATSNDLVSATEYLEEIATSNHWSDFFYGIIGTGVSLFGLHP